MFPCHSEGTVTETRAVTTRANLSALKVNLLYYQMVVGQMPTTGQGLKALVERPTTEPVPKSWRKVVDEVPRDPWDREFQYRNPGKKNPGSYDLFSLGADGIEGTSDDVWPYSP